MAYPLTDLPTKLRRCADKLDASLGQSQSQHDVVLQALRVSLLRDWLDIAGALPEIEDPPTTDDAARRLITFARLHAERIERRLQ
jgi:hypothetical protein